MSARLWQKCIGYGLVLVLCVSALAATRWVWRDITYWSRSLTVAHTADNLGECVAMAVADWPAVKVPPFDQVITLELPGPYDALVKSTETSGVARIVVFGHSASIAKLGPENDRPVQVLLKKLSADISKQCGDE
ncbi:MAG: hypothetical protein ACSHXK_15340 [Oceanococcus sp.]